MLGSVWRKRNPPTLLVGMLIGTTTMKTIWKFFKKLKIELLIPFHPAIPLLGIYPRKILIGKDIHTPIFIAAIFTIAKTHKQPNCPSTEEWIKKMWCIHTHNGILLSQIERNNAICRNMDGPRDYHTKWSTPDRERQISYDMTYM